MKKIKIAIGIIVSFALVLFLAELNYARYFHMAGDSAGYVDLLKRIYYFDDMRSDVFAAAYPIFDLIQNSESICSSNLSNTYEGNSFFRWHAYGVGFVIAWIGGLFTQDFVKVAALVNALNVFAIFFVAILIVKRKKFNCVEAIIFTGILTSFAPLVGAISGQYYFDRLFIPLALFYCYLHLKRENAHVAFISAAVIIVTSLVSERAALMIGALACYLSIFDAKSNKSYRYITLLMALLSISYYLVWVKYFQNSIYNSSTSLHVILANLSAILEWDSSLSAMTREWLITLLPMLALAVMTPKYLFLASIFILPNLLVSVGGSEKIGYVTHYHSYYIPILIFASIVGYSKIKDRISNKQICYSILLCALVINMVNISKRDFVVSPTLTHSLVRDSLLLVEGSDINMLSESRMQELTELFSLIDSSKATVSSSEFLMPLMVSRGMTKLRLLPIGLDDSDYLFVESGISEGDSKIILPLYAATPRELIKINECVLSRITKNYSIIGNKQINGINYMLYKAKNNEKN